MPPSCLCHTKNQVSAKAEGNCACVLQSCPDAIDEVFDSKLHIIGGAGITIGVVMVSGRGIDCNLLNSRVCCPVGGSEITQAVCVSLPFLVGVWDDLQHAPVLRHQEVAGGGVTPTIASQSLY